MCRSLRLIEGVRVVRVNWSRSSGLRVFVMSGDGLEVLDQNIMHL